MSQPRVIISAGHMSVGAEGMPDALVSSWNEAINLIRATFHVERTVVGVEQAGRRFCYVVTADTVATAGPDSLPAVFVRSTPWTVTVSELSAESGLADNRDGAFRLAVSSLRHLPDNPAIVHGELRESSGEMRPITVTTETIYDGHMPLPEYADSNDAIDQLAIVDDDIMDNASAVSEEGLFDDDESFWEDDGVDDNEVIRARIDKRGNHRGAAVALISGGVCLVLVMVMAAFIIPKISDDDDDPAVAETKKGLSKSIAGYDETQTVEWARGVAPKSRVGATPDGKHVATISQGNMLIVSDENTGDESGAVPLGGVPDVGPRGTIVEGDQAVLAQVGQTVTVWREKKDAYTINLADMDDEVIVSFAGAQPLVSTKDGSRTWRFGDGKLESWAPMPKGVRPYAMNTKGEVIGGALDPDRVEIFDKSGKSTSKAEFAKPDGSNAIERWVAVTDKSAILVWKTGSGLTVTVNSVSNGKILAHANYPEDSSVVNSSAVSGDRSDILAFPGGLVTRDNKDAAAIVEVSGFVPESVADTFVYGRDKSGARAMADPTTGEVTTLKSSMAVPWTVTATGKVVVIDESVAYAVTVARETKSPDPTTGSAADGATPTKDS